jgi:hypothetical protein
MFTKLLKTISNLSHTDQTKNQRRAGRQRHLSELHFGIEHLETRDLLAGLVGAGVTPSSAARDVGDGIYFSSQDQRPSTAPTVKSNSSSDKVAVDKEFSHHVISTASSLTTKVVTAADAEVTNRANAGLLSSTPMISQAVASSVPILPGDYNGDGSVDAADYVVWRKTFDSEDVTPFSGADGNGDGEVNEDDLPVWRANFGASLPPVELVAPAITSTAPSGKVAADTAFSYNVTATGTPLPTYSLLSAPLGVTIDNDTGLIAWTPTTAEEGTQSVTVAATNSSGQATQTFSISVIPQTPSGLTANGASTTSIAVSWTASADPNATGYNVYERTFLHNPRGSGGTYHYHLLASDLTTTSFTATGLTAGSSHTYVVVAVNSTAGVVSGYSTAVGGKTWVPPTLQPDFLLSSGAVWSGPVNVAVGQTVQITLLGSGNPAVEYTAVDAPSTLSVDPVTGVVTYTPDDSEVGLVSVTFEASNVLGFVTQTFQFNVI